MSSALWTLLRLHFRGNFRRMLRGVRTPRGLTFLILGILMLFGWLGPAVYRAVRMPRTDPQMVLTVAPFAILGFCLSNLFASFGEKAILFSGPEVDFLFPGPFTRRSLLGYKIIKTALGTTFTAMVFSIMLLRYSRSWIACFIGVWLTIQFMQLFAIAVIMIGQTIGERAYGGTRRFVLLTAAALAIILIAPRLTFNLHGGLLEIMKQVHATLIGQVLLAPFDVFARTITAGSSDFAIWTLVALLINLLMLAVVIGLDANYLETAATLSQRRYERLQRIRRGGVAGMSGSSSARFSVPPLPWLGGAGPIAWRQLTGAVRSSRALFTVVGILAIIAASFIMQQRSGSSSSLEELLGTVAWLNVVFISMLKFDFRDELDRLDVLRSLPIRPAAVAIAEMLTPVLLLTIMQAMLLIAVIFSYHGAGRFVIWAAVFALPFNVLLTAIENLLFLMFPLRAVGLIAGDMQLFGRQMVVFLCKFLLLISALAVAAAFGLIGYIAGNRSWPAFGVAMWIALSLVALSTIPLLARAYARFDPSVDTPA
ncbi:MAG TPA: putative ABC exporter domain-containing protein [Tepidisphaeraceae bacterium]